MAPQFGATFVPGGIDDYYLPEVVAPSPQRYVPRNMSTGLSIPPAYYLKRDSGSVRILIVAEFRDSIVGLVGRHANSSLYHQRPGSPLKFPKICKMTCSA